MDKRELNTANDKVHIYITLILVQCTLALSFVSQAQFPEFTIIDTGAIYTNTGHHVASGWFDMDNDNDLDVIITNSSGMGYTNHPNLLYKNELNGNFIQVTNTGYTLQSLTVGQPGPFGDIDNDGDQDLINADWIGTDHFIYQNDGYGNFESLKNLKQLSGSTSVLFDLDNDSFPDIIQFHEDSSRVYANDGNGNFVDYIDLNIPCQDPGAVVHSIALGDADDDGDFDLYIGYTNVYGGSSIKAKNEFFLNNGSGRFIRQSDQAIIVQDLAMTPSINWIDYDNDGDMDLYVLNSFDKSPANSISGALFENKGDLVFEKHIIEPAVYRDAHRVSSVWGDLDNDGDLDLYITIEKNGLMGHISPIKHNLLLQNNGDGTFSEVYINTLATESSHTATLEDIDNDGDLDVLLVRFSWANNGRNTLCMNEGNDNSWLILNLEGTSSNKTAFGTRIIAKAAINGQHIMQTREITPMSGHATYNSTRVHFGLGDADQVDTLIIRWPSGQVDEYMNVAANNIYRFIEKEDTVGPGKHHKTNSGISQVIQNPKTQISDLPIESKLNYATWRVDYYICTGIAYAKSLGMTVNDFAAFVASKHSITSPNDTSISAVIKTFTTVMTSYPKGKFELLTESNSSAKMRWNRPYDSYFKNGPVIGVSLEEFESYLYGHVAIMTKRIGIDFKYDIKQDSVVGTISRYR